MSESSLNVLLNKVFPQETLRFTLSDLQLRRLNEGKTLVFKSGGQTFRIEKER